MSAFGERQEGPRNTAEARLAEPDAVLRHKVLPLGRIEPPHEILRTPTIASRSRHSGKLESVQVSDVVDIQVPKRATDTSSSFHRKADPCQAQRSFGKHPATVRQCLSADLDVEVPNDPAIVLGADELDDDAFKSIEAIGELDLEVLHLLAVRGVGRIGVAAQLPRCGGRPRPGSSPRYQACGEQLHALKSMREGDGVPA